MRQALGTLGEEAKPLEIQEHLRKEFRIHMNPNMISNYKSMIRSEGSKSRLIRRPGAAASSGAFSLEDIQAVKRVADRIGAEKVGQLAGVLSK